MGNDQIKKKFDDIEGKINLMMENCRLLQLENEAFSVKISSLEADLDGKKTAEKDNSEQEAVIQSKIEGLLAKLDAFSSSLNKSESSSL